MMAAAASVAYDDKVYESPPNVAEAPASEGHTLSTEEFDETPSAPTTNSFMPIKDAIIEASKYRTGDETKKMTARSIFRLANYGCFLVLVTYGTRIQFSKQDLPDLTAYRFSGIDPEFCADVLFHQYTQ
ncbi:unnamed protein product [Haemonchus placei]|uniref:Transmembrane protein n=1 Tax=Haemonchus placei TaxID=6290 RepID=A0A0N4VX59_HAEPC|nr:unnamed protein product [Haemonchus placei]